MDGRRSRIALGSVLGAVLALATSDPSPSSSPAYPPQPPPFQRGIAVLLDPREDPALPLQRAADLACSHVQIPVHWHQSDIHAAGPEPFADPPPEAYETSIRHAIRRARGMGLEVFVNPILQLDRVADGEWRGSIAPPSWVEFFRRYGSFIRWAARIAQDEGASLFSVGSELVSSESHEAEWRALIRSVRNVYAGPLTYSANWDRIASPPFWDALDLAGVSMYQELVTGRPGYAPTLPDAWRYFAAPIRSFRARIDRPLVLTELGYPSCRNARNRPWDYASRAGVDLSEQHELFAAFIGEWDGDPGLAGIYVWAVESGRGGVSDSGYAVSGKPAESLLRAWFWSRRTTG